MLPNLLILGAPKCGTTSLHWYLTLHPEIAMSRRKELNFFVREDWRARLAWYESHFTEPARVRGEASPGYSMYPYLPSVAERAHEVIPDAKLIYIVRDPVERAVSNYVEFVQLTFEDRPIAEALGDVENAANPHICSSKYATQLEQFLRHFPASQVLVLDSEDLLKRRDRALWETFEFLEVDPDFTTPDFARTHNVREGISKVRYNSLGIWMIKNGILKQRRGPFRRGPLVSVLRRVLSRPIDAALPAATREQLIEVLSPEVERFRELTGKRFESWSSFG